MTRLSLLLGRVRRQWNAPWAVVVRRLAHLLLGRLLAAAVGLVRSMWSTFGARARLAVILAGLILVSSQTAALAPSLSETARGLAVLLVAGAGLWLILTSPFRHRHR
jgi:predicted outer membrane lipoprotein